MLNFNDIVLLLQVFTSFVWEVSGTLLLVCRSSTTALRTTYICTTIIIKTLEMQRAIKQLIKFRKLHVLQQAGILRTENHKYTYNTMAVRA